MTDQEYVDGSGNYCPSCRTKDSARMNSLEPMDGGVVVAECYCAKPDCGHEWNEFYELKGYENQ